MSGRLTNGRTRHLTPISLPLNILGDIFHARPLGLGRSIRLVTSPDVRVIRHMTTSFNQQLDIMTQRFHHTVLALAFALLLAPALLRAQESFPATHISLFRNVSGVPDSLAGSGVGIFRADPDNGLVEYRITILTPGTRITNVNIRTRTGATPEEDPILQTFDYSPDEVTATATLEIPFPFLFSMADEGKVYLDVRTEALPGGHLIGQIEPIPTGITFEIERSQVVPPVDSTHGRGTGYVTIDPNAPRARYHFEWENLTGPPTVVNFHRGSIGENGPAVKTLEVDGDTLANGYWEGLSAEDLRAFKEGRIYVNISTAKYPDGEIRGQILPAETFTAAITAANEMPPNSSDASGTGYLMIVTYPGLGYFVKSNIVVGQTGDSIEAAHVHRGAPDENGPVIFPYKDDILQYWEIEAELGPGDISSQNLGAIRTGNSYVNVHTHTYPDGEARGQWIPTILNVSSSVPTESAEAASMLSARVDGAAGVITFAIDKSVTGVDRRIVLYSSLGERVAELDARHDHPTLNVSDLHSGLYIAQLLVDDRPAGHCRVVMVR